MKKIILVFAGFLITLALSWIPADVAKSLIPRTWNSQL
jgi:hypothetical protein